MATTTLYAYIGTAITYPITVSGGSIAISSGVAVIENSIIKILTTPKGTRYFVPEYGCILETLKFEPNDAILAQRVRIAILDALSTWEKRAKFLDVEVIPITDALICVINYRVLQSNEVNTFVFPFYTALTS
jgi:phage baseplate assembly protein W